MPAAELHLEGERIIEQGSFWSITIRHPGNIENARWRGQIRTGTEGDLLAELQFGRADFNAETNKTSIEIKLSASITEKIPVPPENKQWVYDVLMYSPTTREPIRLLKGRVSVSAGVTTP